MGYDTPRLRPGFTHTGGTLGVHSSDAMAEVIGKLDGVGEGWRIPMFRAARAGHLALALSGGGQRFSKRILTAQRPTLLVVADDHEEAKGPTAWPQADKLFAWAKGAVIHCAAPDARWSNAAVAMTLLGRRVVMVETGTAWGPAWIKAARKHLAAPQLLCIWPQGDQHPIGGAPAGAVVQ